MADRAGVGEIEDADFVLLAQSPGALAGLGQQDQVLRHLEPDYRVDNLEIETLTDPPVADDDSPVAALDRRDDRVFAVFGVYRVGQLPGAVPAEDLHQPRADVPFHTLLVVNHDASAL